MQVVQGLKCFRIALLGSLDRFCFGELALLFACARQLAFRAALSRMRLSSFLLYGLQSAPKVAAESRPNPGDGNWKRY